MDRDIPVSGTRGPTIGGVTTAAEHGTAALRRALEDRDLRMLDTAVDALREAAAGGAPALLSNLGAALRTRHRWAPRPTDLDEAIDALSSAVSRSHPADPALAGRLGTWGVALGDRYERSADGTDLAASVAALERALAAAGPDQRSRQSANLAGALLERHRLHRDPGDLDRAIDLARLAADEPPTATDRDTARRNLAAALHERFTRSGDRADLDAAIAVSLPAGGAPAQPGVLGTLLHSCFVLTGSGEDLDDAATVLVAAEAASSGGDRAAVLGVLGNTLLDRFRWRGDPADLDAAIARHRAAVASTPPESLDRAVRLSNLGVALAARPELHPGAEADLDEALVTHAEAVERAGPGHPDRAAIVAHRASALLTAFVIRGREPDGAAAVTGYREVLALVGANPAVRAGHLAQLARALRLRFQSTGRAEELYEAVRLAREAIEIGGTGHRDHAEFCSYLGSTLTARHLLHGAVDDLAEAIAWHDRALAGWVPGRIGAARIPASRAYALRVRAQRTGDPGDVTAAVEAFRAALEAEADAARLPDLLAALGSALDLRRGSVEDITATIDVRREACRRVNPADPYRGPWLSDLANSLRLRAALLGAVPGGDSDLAEAHLLHVEAVAATSPAHPEYATVLSNLAGSHRDRYARAGDVADLDAALDLLRRTAAVAAAPAVRRFVAAETGGRLAADTGRWADACAAFTAAVDLLPAAVWRGADRPGQEQPLRDARWLAVEAAASALQLDDVAGALDLLERGRAVLWSRRLETDTDLAALRETAPELAERLDAARAVLDGDADRAGATADSRVAAAADWDAATVQLRARPDLAALLPAAVELPRGFAGTVALVVVSRYRSDVLLLDAAGPRVVPLPELDLDALADRVGDYFGALAAIVDHADRAERRAAEKQLADLLVWMGDAVVAPVVDAVPAGSRLWWCPTGPFTYLPLHAAGAAPERVVSSYTPTVGALARAMVAPAADGHRVLGVAVADAAGLPRLPGAPAELDALRAALPIGVGLTRPAPATRAEVGPALQTHTWAHLACHAEQDLARPSHAALVLADGRLGLTEIARRPGRPAEGAYLSACQSAFGGVELTDEAQHLAAALQYAGFRRVIATLWPVTDRRARQASEHVYAALCAGGGFHPARSAEAVHDLALALRERYPDAPSQWAPFVHIGV